MEARQFLAQSVATLVPLAEDVDVVNIFCVRGHHLVSIVGVPPVIEAGEDNLDRLLFVRLNNLILSFHMDARAQDRRENQYEGQPIVFPVT